MSRKSARAPPQRALLCWEHMFPGSATAHSPWDAGLDEAQLAVATHDDQPLLVMAGAGTGKTRALVSRVACLLQRGAAPERVLLLTFTRRAADEMLARASALARLGGGRRPQGGTFHSVAYQHVAASSENLGFGTGFSLLGPSEACDLMDLMRGDYQIGVDGARAPRTATLVDAYSRCINTHRPLHEVLAVDYPWCRPYQEAIAHLFAAYTERKRNAALVDFDDLLLYWRALLESPDLGPRIASQWDHVLVDEYQDVNSLQVDIVRLLAPGGRGLTIVGDEAQAVYGFRGADARQLRSLVVGYPGATVVTLGHNFRSHQGILDVANRLRPAEDGEVTLFSDRTRGARPRLVRCHDASSEARALVDRVLEANQDGTALRDQAVLVRASHHSDLVEVELTARRVPFRKYGGLRFLEAAHVKDFIAAARLVDNPHDEVALYRLARLHDHIGPSAARRLVEQGRSCLGPLANWAEIAAGAPPRSRAALATTLSALNEARSASTPGRRAEAVLEAIRPLVQARYRETDVRLADLRRLTAAAASSSSLASLVAELTLCPPESSGDLAGAPSVDEDYLVISTIHSAKGLEWPVVHVPHVVDGFIPIDMALTSKAGLEEERRLFYVAVTRAQDALYLYSPLRMPYHRQGSDDRHGFATLSRFVDPTVSAMLETVDDSTGHLAALTWARGATGLALEPLRVDLSSLWS